MSDMHVNPFRLGADPEFALLNIYNEIHNFRTNDYFIGNDHGTDLIELRPKPAYTVKGLILNIKTMLDSPILKPVHEYRWKAGAVADGTCLGGHIHIEVPCSYSTSGLGTNCIPAVDRTLFQSRLNSMDLVTRVFEELNFLPQEECETRRRISGYGRFGATQEQRDNTTGIQRTEYRTPCSWLFSPRNAFMYITAIKLAVTSPVSVQKTLKNGVSKPVMYDALVKMYRNFQHIDEDSNISANRICRSANADNVERLKANTEVDFKLNWKLRGMQPLSS